MPNINVFFQMTAENLSAPGPKSVTRLEGRTDENVNCPNHYRGLILSNKIDWILPNPWKLKTTLQKLKLQYFRTPISGKSLLFLHAYSMIDNIYVYICDQLYISAYAHMQYTHTYLVNHLLQALFHTNAYYSSNEWKEICLLFSCHVCFKGIFLEMKSILCE